MGVDRIHGAHLGAIVRQHREARGLDVAALSAAIGGTPGPRFLTSLEAGSVGASSSLVLKLADVLGLPHDLMLNAAGYATQTQRALALAALPEVRSNRRSDA